jgi:PAS domain-containing protein
VRGDDTLQSILLPVNYDYKLLAMVLLPAVIGVLLLFLFAKWREADAKRRGEKYFNLLAEAIPQIVWTAIPGAGMDYCNQRLSDLTGLTREKSLGAAGRNYSIRTICPWLCEIGRTPAKPENPTRSNIDCEPRREVIAGTWCAQLPCATPKVRS